MISMRQIVATLMTAVMVFFVAGASGLSSIVSGIAALVVGIFTYLSAPLFGGLLDEEKQGWEWFRENVVELLLDEVSNASEGDLPVNSSEYRSEWWSLPESTRDLVSQYDRDLKQDIDEYSKLIEDYGDVKQTKQELAAHFITDLPSGDVQELEFEGDVTRSGGVMTQDALPENRGVMTDLDEWLLNTWGAFEDSDDSEDLERRIRSKYNDMRYDSETIRYWENSGWIDWADELWSMYEKDYLSVYKKEVEKENILMSEVTNKAQSIEKKLREYNKRKFLKSKLIPKIIWD